MKNFYKKALENGSVELRSGVYLCSQEHLTEEQAAWSDEDECKSTDFTTAPFWITTDSGTDPIAVDDGADLSEYTN